MISWKLVFYFLYSITLSLGCQTQSSFFREILKKRTIARQHVQRLLSEIYQSHDTHLQPILELSASQWTSSLVCIASRVWVFFSLVFKNLYCPWLIIQMWKIWNKYLPPLLHVTLLFPNPQPTSTTTFIHRLTDSQEVHRLVSNCWQDETTYFYASVCSTHCVPPC